LGRAQQRSSAAGGGLVERFALVGEIAVDAPDVPAVADAGVNVRATDESSFKLLSLVPLVSGGGIAVLLSTNTTLARLPLVAFVSRTASSQGADLSALLALLDR
jgi:hypothetical protein